MKNLIRLSVIVFGMVAFASCKTGTTETKTDADSTAIIDEAAEQDMTAVDTSAQTTDSVAVDTTKAQ